MFCIISFLVIYFLFRWFSIRGNPRQSISFVCLVTSLLPLNAPKTWRNIFIYQVGENFSMFEFVDRIGTSYFIILLELINAQENWCRQVVLWLVIFVCVFVFLLRDIIFCCKTEALYEAPFCEVAGLTICITCFRYYFKRKYIIDFNKNHSVVSCPIYPI